MDNPVKIAPSTAGMTTKVIKGSIWTLAGQVLPLAVSLVTTPFTIRLLGAEGYGVLILIGLIPTYLAFADFGMGMASTKFASEAYAEGDEEKEGAIIRTSALISLLMSVPFAAGMAIFANQIIGLFNVPEHFFAEAVLSLRIASITFVITFLCNIFNTPQLTRLRMDLNSIINATSRIIGLIATPLVIYLGYGVLGVTVVLFTVSLLNLILHLGISYLLLPNLLGLKIDSARVSQLLKFGSGLLLAAIATVLVLNFEKLLIPVFLNVEELAYYSIAMTLATMMTLFSSALLNSIIPAFSQLQGETNKLFLSSLYSRSCRLLLIWLIPIIVISISFAEAFFNLWAGEEFGRRSFPPFLILLIGIGLHVYAAPARALIIASGRSDIVAKIIWLELVPHLTITFILTYILGIHGAALAWSFIAFLDALIYLSIVRSRNRVQINLKGVGAFSIISGVMISLVVFLRLNNVNLFLISLVCILGLIVYSGIILKYFLEKEELEWIKQRFSFIPSQ